MLSRFDEDHDHLRPAVKIPAIIAAAKMRSKYVFIAVGKGFRHGGDQPVANLIVPEADPLASIGFAGTRMGRLVPTQNIAVPIETAPPTVCPSSTIGPASVSNNRRSRCVSVAPALTKA